MLILFQAGQAKENYTRLVELEAPSTVTARPPTSPRNRAESIAISTRVEEDL
jgi:hypothetical protein